MGPPFDGSNCGLKLKASRLVAEQYHPEASPGRKDSHYLFTRFVELMARAQGQSVEAMPKRTEIKTILMIGGWLIVIGQACEFDLSGTRKPARP